jgi:hypothetical protein
VDANWFAGQEFDPTVLIEVGDPKPVLDALYFDGKELDPNQILTGGISPDDGRPVTFVLGSITNPNSDKVRPNTMVAGAIYPTGTTITWWQDTDLKSIGLAQ